MEGHKRVQNLHVVETIGDRTLDRGDWVERGF